jgi:hypothetical protein
MDYIRQALAEHDARRKQDSRSADAEREAQFLNTEY